MHTLTMTTDSDGKSQIRTETTIGTILNPIEMLTKEYTDCARGNSLFIEEYAYISDVINTCRNLSVEFCVILKEDDNWDLGCWINAVEAIGDKVPVVDGYYIIKF